MYQTIFDDSIPNKFIEKSGLKTEFMFFKTCGSNIFNNLNCNIFLIVAKSRKSISKVIKTKANIIGLHIYITILSALAPSLPFSGRHQFHPDLVQWYHELVLVCNEDLTLSIFNICNAE
jgi:hypothetical protein